MSSDIKSPKVFVSYSWTSDRHKARIRMYAERLRQNGVDVVMDVWDLQPGQDLTFFMEKMVLDKTISHVLVFIDNQYTSKANARKDGVGTEAQIISRQLYSKVDQTKFIPIFCEASENGALDVPEFFGSRLGYDFTTPEAENENWELLLRFLFNKPLYAKPKLGNPPAFLSDNSLPVANPSHTKLDTIKDIVNRGNIVPKILMQGYANEALEFLGKFQVDENIPEDEIETYDEKVQETLISLLPFRNDFIEWLNLLVLQYGDKELVELLEDLLPRFREVCGPGPHVNTWRDGAGEFDVTEVFSYEIVLYLVAILIKERRDDALHEILFSRYYVKVSDFSSRYALYGLDAFACGAASFIRRKQRLNLNRADLLADWVKEHIFIKVAKFSEVMEADAILWLVSQLESPMQLWVPRTLVFASYGGRDLPLFAKAADKKHANRLLKLFGYTDLSKLRADVAKAAETFKAYSYDRLWLRHMPSSLDVENWGTLN